MRRHAPPPLDGSRRALVEAGHHLLTMAERVGWPVDLERLRPVLRDLLTEEERAVIDWIEDEDPAGALVGLYDQAFPGTPRPTDEERHAARVLIVDAVRAATSG